MKKIIIVLVAIVIMVVAWFVFVKKPANVPIEISSGLGGHLFEQTSKANPFDKNLNPYDGAYINPFK